MGYVGIIALLVVNFMFAFNGKFTILYFAVPAFLIFLFTEAYIILRACTKDTKTNIRMLLSSVFVIIIIGELVLRGSGKYDSYNEKSGHVFYISPYRRDTHGNQSWLHLRSGRNVTEVETYPEFTCVIELSSEGLRDIDHGVVKAHNEFRIIGLGDSFTEGCGVALGEETWVKMLERSFRLSELSITTVLNGGVSGSDPFYEYLLLKEKLLKYGPDLVIVAINSSDVIDVVVRGGIERFKEDGSVKYKRGPWFEPLFGMSHLVRLFILNVLDYDWYLLEQQERVEKEKVAIEQIYSSILMFEELSRKAGFELLIVFQPLLDELINEKFPFDELIMNLEKEKKVAVLDLLDFYLQDEKVRNGNAAAYYWPLDLHHNKEGYALFAKGVRKKLENMNLSL